MLRWVILLGFTVVPVMAQTPMQPEVSMKFSSERILLGEPVWVLVTAHNGSDAAMKWNPGDYCFMDKAAPVTAVVPEATPGNGKQEPCEYGMPGGNCMMGGNTTTLAPGESATWRFLLEGDFSFTHAGTYHVQLTSHPGRAFQSGKAAVQEKPAEITQTLVLKVLPKDDAALLAREKQMAADMEAEMLPAKREPMPMEEEKREASFRESMNVRRVRNGLAAQPVVGMEAVFEHWLQLPNDFESDAVAGLKNLNTKESRADIAEIAKTPNKPNSYIEESATYALGETGDRQYVPLLVELTASPNQRVRRAAIRSLGDLGGDTSVAKLVEIAHTGESIERGDAVSALGHTDSRTAVKALIDLMSDPRFSDASWPLFVLTHQRLSTEAAWQQWWNTGGNKAPVYSQFECAPKGSL